MNEKPMNTEDVLKSFVERLERLQEEKDSLSADIREVLGEAKDAGFDVKALREVLRERKVDAIERSEQAIYVSTYKTALGM